MSFALEGKNIQLSLAIFMMVLGLSFVFFSLKKRETFDVPLISKRAKHFVGGVLMIGGVFVAVAYFLVK